MRVGADCPENWNRQGGEGLGGNSTHTECVDEKIVLDLIYVPEAKLALQRKGRFSWNHTRSPPSDRPSRRYGVPPVCSEFWKNIQ